MTYVFAGISVMTFGAAFLCRRYGYDGLYNWFTGIAAILLMIASGFARVSEIWG